MLDVGCPPMFFPVFFSGPGIEVASLPELGPGGSWSNLEIQFGCYFDLLMAEIQRSPVEGTAVYPIYL